MKKTLNIVLLALLSGIAAYFSLLNFYLPLSFSWIQLILISVFFLFGVLFIVTESKASNQSFQSQFLFSLLQFLILFAVVLGVYSFFGRQNFFLVLACSSAFLFPKIFYFSWQAFRLIAQSARKIWYGGKTTQGAVNFLYGMPLQLKVSLKQIERRKKLFPIKAPLSMKLGEFFNHFLLMQNSKWQKIQVTTNEQEPFGWEFFEESLGGLIKRRLDPDINVVDNGVKPNSVIVALRVVTKKKKAEAY